MLSSLEQKLMHHSAAECTICAIKGAPLVFVMIYCRIQPFDNIKDQPYDNRTREENATKKMANNDTYQTGFAGVNKIIFGAASVREEAEYDSEFN